MPPAGYPGPGRPPNQPPNQPPPNQPPPNQPPPNQGPAQGPPPGYWYPGQQLPPQQPGKPKVFGIIWALAGVAVVGVVLGLSIEENGNNAWHSVHAWGAVPIVGAVLTAATAYGTGGGLTARQAWKLAVTGAALLVVYWILLVLPQVGSNTSLLTTAGTVAGVLAVWIAPVPADRAQGPEVPPGQAW
jgi:hypothetical protein